MILLALAICLLGGASLGYGVGYLRGRHQVELEWFEALVADLDSEVVPDYDAMLVRVLESIE